MKLRDVFPTLLKFSLGTLIIVAIIVIIVEWYNFSQRTMELMHICRKNMQTACAFVSKESFRGNDIEANNRGVQFSNLYDLQAFDRHVVVSGQFYEDTEDATYRKMFEGNSYFDSYMEWLTEAFDDKDFKYTRDPSFMYLYNVYEDKEEYIKYHVTPLNLGLTYLDPEITLHVFKWFLTNELSLNGIHNKNKALRSTIRQDEKGYYIRWYGFRIYIDNTNIYLEPSERCRLYAISDPDDLEELSEYTSLTEEYLNSNGIKENELRNYKILYDLRWDLDLQYEGLLPIGFLWNILFYRNPVYSLNKSNGYMGTLGAEGDYGTIKMNPGALADHSSVNKNSEQGNPLFSKTNTKAFGNTEDLNGNFLDTSYIEEVAGRLGDKDQQGSLGLAQRMRFVIIQ